MQVKQWIVIAGLMVAAPLLVACGEEKAEDAAPPSDSAPADTAPADEAAPAPEGGGEAE